MTTVEQLIQLRRHPDQPVVMRQTWRELTFLHWKVDPAALRSLVPAELDLDLWNEDCYIGLVPFTMEGVRPVGVPRFRPLTDFHETNVRTYVRYKGGNPGVWFFSLEAANQLAVSVARTWFGLPYHFASMSLQWAGDRIEYRSNRLQAAPPARCRVVARPHGAISFARPGTLEFFVAERYLLYCQRGGKLFSGRVLHVPYPLRQAEALHIDQSLLDVLGIRGRGEPDNVLYSPGVSVELFQPIRVL